MHDGRAFGSSLVLFVATCGAVPQADAAEKRNPRLRDSRKECRSDFRGYLGWGMTGTGLALLAGGQGLGQLDKRFRDDGARQGLAIGMIVTTALAGTAVFAANLYAGRIPSCERRATQREADARAKTSQRDHEIALRVAADHASQQCDKRVGDVKEVQELRVKDAKDDAKRAREEKDNTKKELKDAQSELKKVREDKDATEEKLTEAQIRAAVAEALLREKEAREKATQQRLQEVEKAAQASSAAPETVQPKLGPDATNSVDE